MKYYFLHNYNDIPQIKQLSDELRFDIEVVGTVLPFKVNSYIINELIDWGNIPQDPIFTLTFPRKEMLLPEHYETVSNLLKNNADKQTINNHLLRIRQELNPNQAGQFDYNVPKLGKRKLHGIQHKYKETVLFFPREGQTCHSYCTFCFRWPQFIGIKNLRFASKEAVALRDYLALHHEVTDILFTGGDPMTMSAAHFNHYIEALLDDKLKHVTNIRIGTKAPTYNPYRFFEDPDAKELIDSFRRIIKAGKNLTFMFHISHYKEMETDVFHKVVRILQDIGAVIRTQSPILKGINASSEVWAKMWQKQVSLGMVPYYTFVTRDTGAQHYFGIPLIEAWEIYQKAYQQVSGLCRTVRGPSMSCVPGKIQMLGISEYAGEKVIVLRMLQGRNPDWALRPFFAEYDEKATWISDLKPAFGENKFFFEDELEQIFHEKYDNDCSGSYE